MATATATKPKGRVKKNKGPAKKPTGGNVSSKKAAKGVKKPDPEQLRLEDPETGERINMPIRIPGIDSAFSELSGIETERDDAKDEKKEIQQDLKPKRYREIEAKIKELTKEKKAMDEVIADNPEFRAAVQKVLRAEERRQKLSADLQAILKVERTKINELGGTYLVRAKSGDWYQLSLSTTEKLVCRKAKVREYEE